MRVEGGVGEGVEGDRKWEYVWGEERGRVGSGNRVA